MSALDFFAAPRHADTDKLAATQAYPRATASGLPRRQMGDKDPSPFGYTFSGGGGFFDADPTPFDPSQSLLTDAENQSIADFFTNTDPFHLADPHAFAPALDAKDCIDGFHNWSDFITPATVHGVSTTIPDQSHLHNSFFHENQYAQPSLPAHHLGNTHDDLQAASTLFRNSQSSYNDNRTHSFHGHPSPRRHASVNGAAATDQNGKPLVVTQHGLLSEQLAAVIPHHSEEGTLDAQLAAQWAARNAQQLVETQYTDLRRPTLKRSYTFGTDESFNNSGSLSTPHAQEPDASAQHLLRIMQHSQSFIHDSGTNGAGMGHIEHARCSPPNLKSEEPSEEASSEEDEDEQPAKRRRKSKASKDVLQKGKATAKNRKASTIEDSGKKKRATAAQKLQRENLTEEQKRSNHILSEQKRRNLIKRGFEDLNELVPELRTGGQSRSGALTEAANFLEKLIEDNKTFQQLACG